MNTLRKKEKETMEGRSAAKSMCKRIESIEEAFKLDENECYFVILEEKYLLPLKRLKQFESHFTDDPNRMMELANSG